MNKLMSGVIGGVVGTGAMTAAMEVMHRALPPAQQQPLPPRQITEEVLDRVGAPATSEETTTALTLLNHVGYGVAVGVPFALVAPSAPATAAAAGAAYGLVVWAASYLGWLPALGLLRPATEHDPARRRLMIAAHVVYGAALGLTARSGEAGTTAIAR